MKTFIIPEFDNNNMAKEDYHKALKKTLEDILSEMKKEKLIGDINITYWSPELGKYNTIPLSAYFEDKAHEEENYT